MPHSARQSASDCARTSSYIEAQTGAVRGEPGGSVAAHRRTRARIPGPAGRPAPAANARRTAFAVRPTRQYADPRWNLPWPKAPTSVWGTCPRLDAKMSRNRPTRRSVATVTWIPYPARNLRARGIRPSYASASAGAVRMPSSSESRATFAAVVSPLRRYVTSAATAATMASTTDAKCCSPFARAVVRPMRSALTRVPRPASTKR